MKSVVITVAKNYMGNIDKVVDLLIQAGLKASKLYGNTGVIKGKADDIAIKKIQAHKEISSINVEKTISIAPPSFKIQ